MLSRPNDDLPHAQFNSGRTLFLSLASTYWRTFLYSGLSLPTYGGPEMLRGKLKLTYWYETDIITIFFLN